MRCKDCGNELLPGAKFCGKCGATISAESGAAGAATVIVGGGGRSDQDATRVQGDAEARQQPGDIPAAGAQSAAGEPECPVCHAKLLPNARFCAKCGTVLSAGQVATPPVTPGAAAQQTPARSGYHPAPGQQFAQGPYQYGPARDWIGETISYIPRIFRFEPGVFRQLRADATATPIAVVIAVLAMFAFGVGGWLWAELELDADWELFWQSALVGTGISVGLWLVGALVTAGVLSYVFQKPVRFDEVVRVTGAATAVLALGFMMFIPGISFGISLLVIALWMAVTISALQAAFDLEPREAIVSGAGNFVPWALIFPLIVSGEHTLGPGVWVFESSIDVLRSFF